MSEWIGKGVMVRKHDVQGHKPIEIRISRQTAQDLIAALDRMGNTFVGIPFKTTEELRMALRYVTRGPIDRQATEAHRVMEAGKGMEPGSGDPSSYPELDHTFVGHLGGVIPRGYAEDRCCYFSSGNSGPCWRSREEHPSGG